MKSSTVVYEGYAKSPQYRVEYGSHANQTWRCRGDSYQSLDAAKEQAQFHESRGYDTRILQIGKEVSR